MEMQHAYNDQATEAYLQSLPSCSLTKITTSDHRKDSHSVHSVPIYGNYTDTLFPADLTPLLHIDTSCSFDDVLCFSPRFSPHGNFATSQKVPIVDELHVPACNIPVNVPTGITFNINIKNGAGKKYISESKYLVTNKNVSVGIKFITNYNSTSNSYIRIYVKYARHDGFVERCTSDIDKDSEGNRFMLCHSKGAQYVEYNGQHAVVIPIASILQMSTSDLVGVFSFHCQSSHLSKEKKIKAPDLLMIFELLEHDAVIITEEINLRVCSCVNRDTKKIMAKSGKVCKSTKEPVKNKLALKQLLNVDQIHPLLDHETEKDKDGYYNFTWRGKDKSIFNLLMLISEGYHISNQ